MRTRWLGVGMGILAANVLLAAASIGCTSTDDSTAKSTDETASDTSAVAGTTATATDAQAALEESGILTGGLFGRGLPTGPGHFGPFGGRDGGPFASLSDEQKAQLDAIRQQVESGEITPDEAFAQVQSIIGDILPDGGPHGPMADALALTDEQKTAADEIHAAARADIDAIMENSRTQFRALLTEEQVATLDALEAEREMADSGRPAFAGMGPRGFGPGHGPEGGDHADRLSEALSLTEEQQTAWDANREEAHTAIEARHDAEREAFRALLTDEHLATLDQIEAEHPKP